jgi:deoxyadenosine/deoxycytidine kinase
MAANDSYNTIHEMYRELLAKELQNFNVKTIYMRTDPSQCLSRISMRARPGKMVSRKTIMATLHNVHEAKFSNCDVCVDANNS